MKKLFLFWLSFSLYATTYELNGDRVDFSFYKNKLVSAKKCSKSCLALEVKAPKNFIQEHDSSLGKNPATALCKKLNGEIVLGKSELGHETFFCKFKDNSYIHSGHLL